MLGNQAAPFSTIDLDAKEVSLKKYSGKVIVMNFWFVECKPCVQEIPELNEIVSEFKDEEVIFLGFATNKKSRINRFLKKNNFDYQIIPESADVAKDYKVMGYPTHIIINKETKIVYSTSGLGPTTIRDIKIKLYTLLEK